ncbi:xanthine/CO dehydrogenase XdhC/CoxF family maturation factor [Streptomyces sp. V3I8]|nr:xanthine/CO dehydrogenase XdhC/CoxF family maturation factor [Streptomyces sp. V3I8]
MLNIAQELHRWMAQGRDAAVATVAAVSGSAPRLPGAALAVDAGGTVIGSVSGGFMLARGLEQAGAQARPLAGRGFTHPKSRRILRRSRCSPNRTTDIAATVLTLERQR